MGRTISDIHKIMYKRWREGGMTHEQAINNVPEKLKERFLKDIQMSFIESHFGMKDKWFFLIILIIIFTVPIITIILS